MALLRPCQEGSAITRLMRKHKFLFAEQTNHLSWLLNLKMAGNAEQHIRCCFVQNFYKKGYVYI